MGQGCKFCPVVKFLFDFFGLVFGLDEDMRSIELITTVAGGIFGVIGIADGVLGLRRRHDRLDHFGGEERPLFVLDRQAHSFGHVSVQLLF